MMILSMSVIRCSLSVIALRQILRRSLDLCISQFRIK